MEVTLSTRAELLDALPGLFSCDIVNLLPGDYGDVVLTGDYGINYVTLRGGTFGNLTIAGSGWRVQGATIHGVVNVAGPEIVVTGDPETGGGEMRGGVVTDGFLHGMRARGDVTFVRGRAIGNRFERMPSVARGPVAQRTLLKDNMLNGVPIPDEG
jgi:hypothetical protein